MAITIVFITLFEEQSIVFGSIFGLWTCGRGRGHDLATHA